MIKMDARRLLLLCFFLPLFAFSLSSCAKKAAAPSGPPPAPVTVTQVIQKPEPIEIQSVGAVQAYATDAIRTMVSGQITQVNFKEGDFVDKGDLLFVIDPRPYEVALEQAEANLVKDEAVMQQAAANVIKDEVTAKNNKIEVGRYAKLYTQGYISQESYDLYNTTSASSFAQVDADKAAYRSAKDALAVDRAQIHDAKVQLSYCYVRAPIDGQTGQLLIQIGNVVKANDTPYLVSIAQVSPIYVLFSAPQDQLASIKQYMAQKSLKLLVSPSGDTRPPVEGSISFIDNSVDQTTGTIQMKGVFPNLDRRLWPGEFVNTTLILAVQKNAIVIPSQAIQSGQQGSYVYVVGGDGLARMRQVIVDRAVGDETVISKGLRPGETVVVDGQIQIIPGGQVNILKRVKA